MAPEVSHVTDFDQEIPPRLPLHVKDLVEGVGEFIGPVVIREREELRAIGNGCGIWKDYGCGITSWRRLPIRAPRIVEGAAVRGRRIASGNEVLVKSRDGGANLRIHKRRSLVDSERSTGNHSSSKARRKVCE